MALFETSVHTIPPQASGWPVVGHDRVIGVLRRSLRSGRVSHAYLLTGPPGVGRRTLALIFAMALNCQASAGEGGALPDVPCGMCAACTRIMRGTHPDVTVIDLETQHREESGGRGKAPPAKELKIDTVRELVASIGLRPHSGRFRVYIIGDADRLSEEAANCLLKTLEEPPAHAVLVLIAPDESSVLPTISSRCVHLPIRPLPEEVVASGLVRFWEAEPEQAELLARLCRGRLGAAVEMLHDREALAKRRRALEKLSLLQGEPVADRIREAAEWARLFTDARADLFSMLDTWEGWWRDVLLVGAAADELAANTDQLPALRSTASRVPVGKAAAAVRLIQRTRQQLNENVNPRLALEALALGLP